MSPEHARAASTAHDPFAPGESHKDLKGRTIRGGVVTVLSQFSLFAVSMGSTMIMARLLTPADFGLVGMVMAVTAVLTLVRDSGLSTATVQRDVITRELISTVFWINIAFGVAAAIICAAITPVLVAFYREPELYWITPAIASTFLVDAAGAQHVALLRRQMRLKAVAAIDVTSNIIGMAVGIVMAWYRFGYWSLVGVRIATTIAATLMAWILESWRPGLPRRRTGVADMMKFGGNLTGVGLMNYAFRNVDNILIGWYWGAGPLGFYQKAYSLLMLPINQVNGPISGVAVATLSRIQSDRERQRRYFIGGYELAASIILPIVAGVTVFAEEVIGFVLGSQWTAAATIFRYLAPAALIGALLNPFGWLFVATGRADRQLRAGLVWAPVVVLGFALGLSHGPEGVAIGYSITSALLAIPLCIYAVHGTGVRPMDVAKALRYPVIAGIAAGIFGWALKSSLPETLPVGVRAIAGCALVGAFYLLVFLVVLRQWTPYRDLLAYVFPGRFGRKSAGDATGQA